MIAAQQTTNGVLGDNGITVSDDLVYRQATQAELEKIGFQGPGMKKNRRNFYQTCRLAISMER